MKFFIKFLPLALITINLLPITIRAQQEKAGSLTIQPYVFENSRREKVDAEFGRLLVPENRKNPQSQLIELAFVRFKSSSPNPRSPIIYLAGGPGGSGIASARGNRFPVFMAMREFGDVIALDQRGVGQSNPNLLCRETYGLPPNRAPAREEIIRITKERLRSCAEYWRGQKVDLSGYNTNENADDIEALRRAIGANKVSLWGNELRDNARLNDNQKT